jgi:hypothetical protein
MLTSRRRFNRRHFLHQGHVIGVAIGAGMDAAVAGRTERDDKGRMIGSAVAKPASLMRFQIGCAVYPSLATSVRQSLFL